MLAMRAHPSRHRARGGKGRRQEEETENRHIITIEYVCWVRIVSHPARRTHPSFLREREEKRKSGRQTVGKLREREGCRGQEKRKKQHEKDEKGRTERRREIERKRGGPC